MALASLKSPSARRRSRSRSRSRGARMKTQSSKSCLRCIQKVSVQLILWLVLAAAAVAPVQPAHNDLKQQMTKPPRGYCAPISRAVSGKSRCFGHLLQPTLSGHAQGTTTLDATNDEKKRNNNKVEGGEKEEQEQEQEEEELVYVRLETSGSSMADLSTRAINERLLLGVFDELFNDHRTQKTTTTDDIRSQILDEGGTSGGEGSKCRWSVERLVCRLVYPTCHFRRLDVSALVRPPCREDCFLLRDLFCANLNWSHFVERLQQAFNSTLMAAIKWPLQLEPPPTSPLPAPSTSPQATSPSLDLSAAISRRRSAVADKRGGQQLDDDVSSAGAHHESVRVPPIHFYWPHEHSIKNCERLPPLRAIYKQAPIIGGPTLNQLSGRASSVHAWPICSNAHLTELASNWTKAAVDAVTCLKTRDGIDYQGQENRTASGLECQSWTSQTPHKHTSSELLFDNMRDAKNYCRNPGGLELRPWCYTTNPNVRWQYCNIGLCT